MALFLVPDRNAQAIVGVRPPLSPGMPPESVWRHLAAKRMLGLREHLRAALDESWLDDGAHGLALTNGRLFRYSGKQIRTEVCFGEVDRAAVRRLWHPGVAGARRGESLGRGPVVLLRLTFDLMSGETRQLRVSAFAADVYPLVEGLIRELGAKLEVRRTMPGV